jgi:nucleotide-binding universal stress UspA family protein
MVDKEIVLERHVSAADALLAQVRRRRPHLTVMATHGRSSIAHFFLGSVTEKVVHEGDSPVLCVREPEHGVALPYRRILVPTDLSPASTRAFPLASLLARRFEAEVVAVHVASVDLPRGRTLFGVPDRVDATPTEAALMRFVSPAFVGARVVPQVLSGHPWDRIVEAARLERADLIVLSTHGHHGFAARVLGSHAERILRRASCPVLVV